MMTLKLLPNVVTHLPLASYYTITFLGLYVGRTGIKSCIIKIGDKDIEFRQTSKANDELLAVNGDPNNTPTHHLLKENEAITLVLPEGLPETENEPVFLHHFLNYSVPRTKNA